MNLFPINAALARFLIPRFIRWGLTANQLTALSLAAGLAGCANLLQGTQAATVWGAVWFLLANLLDECDGSVARATGSASGFGSWFDTVAGCIVHSGFFLALGWGMTRQSSERVWALLGSLAAMGVVLATVTFVGGQSLVRGRAGWIHPDPPRTRPLGGFEWLRGGLRCDFSIVVLIAAIGGWLRWLLWGGLIGTFLFWIPTDFYLAARIRCKKG